MPRQRPRRPFGSDATRRSDSRAVCRHAKQVLTAGALLACCATVLPAQQPGAAADSVQSVLAHARTSRWLVRATLVQGSRFEGRLRAVSDTAAVLGSHRFDPARLSLLERRVSDQRYTKRRALIGGAVGVAFGLLWVAPLARASGGHGNVLEDAWIAGEIGLAGAALGAVAGGILSTGQTMWTTAWRR